MPLFWARNLFRVKSGPRRKHRPWHKLAAELLEDRTLMSAANTLQQAYGQLPLSFEANNEQTACQVQYLSYGSGYALFLTENSAVLSLTRPSASTADGKPTSINGVALAMNLVGANPQATVSGLDQQAGITNYFIGNNPSDWHTGIANYGKVEYQNVYSGINLVYYGNQQQLEYDFVVAPGANPSDIQLSFQGADSISLDAQGDLVLHTASGDVLQHAPVIYQEVGGVRQTVPGRFVLGDQGQVSFQVGAYNAGLPLTIDPVLSYSSYLGGNANDYGKGIAVDGSGDAYVVGETSSTNFPTTMGAFQTSNAGSYNAFVTELNPSGTALVYSTYLGGSNDDEGYGIAVDGSGDAYVTGETSSADFPTTTGAFQTSLGGYQNAFVTELNASGTSLVYSTYLGGSSYDAGNGIAVDSSGNAYVVGVTLSSNFPTTAGAFQPGWSGSEKAFITKLNPTGTALAYSTYLGGSSSDGGTGIALDGSDNAYVTGFTNSTDFPTTAGAFQASHANDGGYTDAFVTELNPTGSALVYSTYLGGNHADTGYGIAVDSSGDAYVTGSTASTNFPTTAGAFQTHYGGGVLDAFVTKLNANGTGLVYSTYLGGSGEDRGFGIAVNASGYAFVTGDTASANFPTTTGAFQTSSGGGDDAFVTALNSTGSALAYSTYLGGSSADIGQGIALDASGNAYVTGSTYSSNFPTTTGAFQTSLAGYQNAFVAKFDNSTTTTVTSNPVGPITQGDSVDFTANISNANPGNAGTVSFYFDYGQPDQFQIGGAVNVNNGSATSAATTALPFGSDTITAIYSGGPGFAGSQSTVTLTVNQTTTTSVMSNPVGPITQGDSVDFTATIANANPGNVGSVSFYFDYGQPDQFQIGGAVNVSNGSATSAATTALPYGSDTITAIYSGGVDFDGSQGTVTLTVNQATTTSVTSNPVGPITQGDTVAFTADIANANPGNVGSVSFYFDYGQPDQFQIGGAANVSNGSATSAATTALPFGSDTITAIYSGGPGFAGSMGTVTLTVNQATSTSVTSNPVAPITQGDSVDFTADIANANPGNVGTVSFYFDYGQPDQFQIGGAVNVNNGSATSAATTALPAGSDTITAIYSGGPGFTGSMGTVTLTVNQATTTSVTSNPIGPITQGDSVDFTADIANANPGNVGTVSFYFDYGQPDQFQIGGAVNVSNGSATSAATTALPYGSDTISAIYSGGPGFAGSMGTVTLTVNQTTTTSVSSNPVGPITQGDSVDFTADIANANPGNVGSVSFYFDYGQSDQFQIGGPVNVNNGSATSAATTALPVGADTITAIYSGGVGFAGSQGTLIIQVNSSTAPIITAVEINEDIPALWDPGYGFTPGSQRSMVNDVVYTFSEPVNILAPGVDPNVFTITALTVNGITGTVPTLSWAPVAGANNAEWAVTFSGNGVDGGSIADGAYQITVTDPSSITAVSDSQALTVILGLAPGTGNPGYATQAFFRLFGDINGNEIVNAQDNADFKQALAAGGYNQAFDWDGNGAVNALDNAHFKHSLAAGYNFLGFTPTI